MPQNDQPVPSLSQDEAQERAALLNVERYDIDVDLTGLAQGDELRARSTVTFTATAPGASTFVDCVGEVGSASLNGADIAASAVSSGRIALADLAEHNVLTVESVQRSTAHASGVHRSVDAVDGEAYVWMSFEPDDARRAWACFDQPDLKAPVAFTVTAPAGWTVLSNSGDPVVDDDGAQRHWRFPDTPPLSTYVPVVNAGPFVERRIERDGHELGLLTRRSLAPFLERDADELFELTAAGLAFYGERFGLPFPQRRYDQVFVPDLGGAMENYGCITWSDSFLFRSPPSPAQRELRAIVLLHEMAHMWFGDMVTMRWWDDLWLNESFATWASCWAAVNATEWTDAWAATAASQKTAGYRADRSPVTHPIRQPVRDVAEAAASFDDITYLKGAGVLKQLVAYVGEDAFVAGLRNYFAEHQWGNATLDDLMTKLASASGRDLEGWTRGWLDRSGTDVLSVGRTPDGLTITASGPDGQPPRPHRVNVGVYDRDGERLVRRDVLELVVDGPSTDLPDSAAAADLLLVNDDDLTFADVRPDTASLRALTESAGLLPTPVARAVAVATAWNRLTTAELTPSRFLQCTLGVLEVETADAVIEPFLRMAVEAANLWAEGATRERLLGDVADTCSRLAEAGGDRAMVALRSLALVATSDDHFATLERAAEDDLELSWRIQMRLAALGRYDPEAVRQLRERDPDPEAWARQVVVETAQPLPEAKEAAWRRIVSERSFPIGPPLYEAGRAFWQPGQDDVVAPYADRYLEALPALSQAGMLAAMSICGTMFPTVAVDETFADRALTAAHEDGVSPLVSKNVADDVDLLRRRITARGMQD